MPAGASSVNPEISAARSRSIRAFSSACLTLSPPIAAAVPRIDPPNRPPAMPASRYSASASSLSRGSPA